jgi:hypothetical protein
MRVMFCRTSCNGSDNVCKPKAHIPQESVLPAALLCMLQVLFEKLEDKMRVRHI